MMMTEQQQFFGVMAAKFCFFFPHFKGNFASFFSFIFLQNNQKHTNKKRERDLALNTSTT
jgi:hypothetical protein|tara:strand:- start:52 stop:231 length:180 start_codon:yes stop_codon:yes gene_type:complete